MPKKPETKVYKEHPSVDQRITDTMTLIAYGI